MWNCDGKEVKMEKSQKITAVLIFVNVILLAMKYTFAMLSGSVDLAADATHSSSDVMTSLGTRSPRVLSCLTLMYRQWS
jgi:divalent metal cation (Fe/Co/Zn/Cd) transporter